MPSTKTYKQFNQSNPCYNCGAKCCRLVTLGMGKLSPIYINHLMWVVAHKNISLGIDGDDYAIIINEPCMYLKENQCTIHEDPNRPEVCKEFTIEHCEEYNHQTGIVVNTPEEFKKYLKEVK